MSDTIPRPDPERKGRLAGVHPRLVEVVNQIFPIMAILGHPMFVTEGVRSAERQQALFAQGRTAPGRRVTNVDGVVTRGKHQIDPLTGWGKAVDCAFQGPEPWAESHPWGVYVALVKWFGLRAGADFKSIKDCPHMELA